MRARIVVLALVVTPFLAGYSQTRGKNKESARSESSVKSSKAPGNVEQQGQHGSDDSACPAGTVAAKSSSKGQNQQGQHEDAKCAAKPPVPTTPVGIAQIHGTVYNDVTGDGKFDYFEAGVAGWTVTLSGPVTATAVTAWDGSYAFTALPVGTYTVCATVQASWAPTAPTTGPCAGGFGWTLDVPATMPDLWYGSIDFGVKGL